jgi:hypothetical protein
MTTDPTPDQPETPGPERQRPFRTLAEMPEEWRQVARARDAMAAIAPDIGYPDTAQMHREIAAHLRSQADELDALLSPAQPVLPDAIRAALDRGATLIRANPDASSERYAHILDGLPVALALTEPEDARALAILPLADEAVECVARDLYVRVVNARGFSAEPGDWDQLVAEGDERIYGWRDDARKLLASALAAVSAREPGADRVRALVVQRAKERNIDPMFDERTDPVLTLIEVWEALGLAVDARRLGGCAHELVHGRCPVCERASEVAAGA